MTEAMTGAMTGVADRLARLIRWQGPITVAQFMAEALIGGEDAYYTGRDPLGTGGDFITAPEISQMFGELIGLWCVDVWQNMGAPSPVLLVELGPGRGTLLADLWRAAASAAPEFTTAAQVHLVEVSPTLRAVQAATLEALPVAATWHGQFGDLPDGPLLLVANEFFDALPIHQFVATEHGWRERYVAAGDEGEGFRFVLAPGPTAALALMRDHHAPQPPAVAEVSPATLLLAGEIGTRIAGFGGGALIVDFAKPDKWADSLQAVRAHQRTDPLTRPGRADIAAAVDFDAIAHQAAEAGAVVHGPTSQGAFLRALGIEARAASLSRNADPAAAREITSASDRLISPAAMGELFRVVALTTPAQPAPAGFSS